MELAASFQNKNPTRHGRDLSSAPAAELTDRIPRPRRPARATPTEHHVTYPVCRVALVLGAPAVPFPLWRWAVSTSNFDVFYLNHQPSFFAAASRPDRQRPSSLRPRSANVGSGCGPTAPPAVFSPYKKGGKTAIFFNADEEPPSCRTVSPSTLRLRPDRHRSGRQGRVNRRTAPVRCVVIFFKKKFFFFTPPTAFLQAESAAPMNNGDKRFSVGKPANSYLPLGDD